MFCYFFFLMIRRPPRATRTDTLFPYTTLFRAIISDTKVAKISVVGVGMKSHAGIAAGMFKSLADRGINILAISTSEIKVSVLIDEDETERSEEHTSELQSLMRISYAVFCLKKKTKINTTTIY